MNADRLLLLEHFRQIYVKDSKSSGFTLSQNAEKLWLSYLFPGNVRELRNIVIRLTAKYGGKEVDADGLAAEFESPEPAIPALETVDLVSQLIKEIEKNPEFNLDAALSRWERAYIEAAQRIARGNISQTARILGVNRSTLYDKMETLSRDNKNSKN